jgi:uncharacterized membrane protein
MDIYAYKCDFLIKWTSPSYAPSQQNITIRGRQLHTIMCILMNLRIVLEQATISKILNFLLFSFSFHLISFIFALHNAAPLAMDSLCFPFLKIFSFQLYSQEIWPTCRILIWDL